MVDFTLSDTQVNLRQVAHDCARTEIRPGQRNTPASSHAKRFAADTGMAVAPDAVRVDGGSAAQVEGGYGFIQEYPVETLVRDAKIMQLYEGTAQIRRQVIARETLLPRPIDEPTAA